MSDVGMSVDGFRQILRHEIEKICAELGKSYDKEQDRGYAFELWLAEMLIREYDIDLDPSLCTYQSRDLKIDVAFDDEESRSLVLAQSKFVSLSSNPNLEEDEVAAFFDRHNVFLEQSNWVRQHASDELLDLISDYKDRINSNWSVSFYFVSTGKASDRIKMLVRQKEAELKKEFPNIEFRLIDFYGLKEEYIRSKSIEATISDSIEVQFGSEKYIIKNSPYKTILSIIKGTTLASLYKKERERLFAYNIRTYLGKRVNRPIIDTAVNDPDNFYYFNNGVSAICTHIHDLGNNKFRFDNFQIINGAQTVGSLAQIANLDPKCEVVLKITQAASVKTEKGFNADIIRYNNTQNIVKASDFRANDSIQLWLEDRFSQLKARGALSEPLRYVRKRTHRRVRNATAVKFEELAKIRYAFFYEPTQCIADPRSLWTTKEDGGLYERAFGVGGVLNNYWEEKDFYETIFAIIVYIEIVERINVHIKQDKVKYFFLQRLRFWALSLSALHIEKKAIDFSALLASEKRFKEWFSEFWRDIFRDLVQAYKSAQEAKISNFALARNETRWNNTKETVALVLGADLG